jgi:hypothetical protein
MQTEEKRSSTDWLRDYVYALHAQGSSPAAAVALKSTTTTESCKSRSIKVK